MSSDFRRLAGLALLAVTLLLPYQAASGQGRLVTKDDSLSGKEKTEFYKLRDGNNAVLKVHKPLLDKAARWYVGRITWKESQNRSLEEDENSNATISPMHRLVREAISHIRTPDKFNARTRDNQLHFTKEYGKAVIAVIDEILKDPAQPAIAKINAVRILAHLGKTSVEEFAGPMTVIIDNPQHGDAIKLFALRGLTNLFESNTGFKNTDQETATVTALDQFVIRPPNYPKSADDAERAAFRYVRREAIRALGAAGLARVTIKGKPANTPALHLLKVLSKDGVDPEPDLRERIEAAISLCNMKAKLAPGYRVDYAARHIGAFMADFGLRYNEDRSRTGGKTLAWAVDAIRLDQALAEFKKNHPDNYVGEVVDRSQPILKEIQGGKPALPAGIRNLMNWLGTNPPPSKTVYADDPDSAVKLPAGSE